MTDVSHVYFLAVILLASAFSQQARANEIRILVPAYATPCCEGGPQMWSTLTASVSALEDDLVIILNPDSGPGESPINGNYITPSADGPFVDYRNAGGMAIGYIATGNTDKPLAVVQSEIDRYFDAAYWRGAGIQIDGVFFDEMSPDLADTGYYMMLADYVRGYLPDAFLVGNPGTTFLNNPSQQTLWSVSDYVETLDLLVTFENNLDQYLNNYTPPSWAGDYSPARQGHVVYALSSGDVVDTVEVARQRGAGYLYLTDDDFPNPYDFLAGFWDDFTEVSQETLFLDGFEQ